MMTKKSQTNKQCKFKTIWKGNKRIAKRNNFAVVFANTLRVINPHATWCSTGGDVFISSVMYCATWKGKPGVPGRTFDGAAGTRWWWDVHGGAEVE